MVALSANSFLVILLCSISCAIIGNFVLWKKLSFFGDATSHSALFGVALGVFLETNQILTLVIFNLLFSIITYFIAKQKSFAIDSIIMIVAYFFIACAILFNNSFNKGFELEEFIFGDVLNATPNHVFIIATLCLSISLFAKIYLHKFLITIINPDLAKVKKIKSDLINFYFMSLLSFLIAFAINVTGIFLATALMIVPCAISRIFSKNPSQMMFNSVIISVIFSTLGAFYGAKFSLSIAPLIIFIQSAIFFILLIIKNFLKNNNKQ